MSIQASNVAVPLDGLAPDGDSVLRRAVARGLGVKEADLGEVHVLRRSIDARKKSNVHGVITAAVELPDGVAIAPGRGITAKSYEPPAPLSIPYVGDDAAKRPIVVGMGPAGLFAAWYLAQAGLRPLVIERGAPVEQRVADVERFEGTGELDPESNVQFGEGGAGTFSDGKLATGIKSPHIRHVLELLVAAGAPEEILVDAQPHIGTDRLRAVVRCLREQLLASGADIRFHTRLDELLMDEGRLRAVRLCDLATGRSYEEATSCVVLACGHSARDTFAMLQGAGAPLERKPFAVGVRIEHPQEEVDRSQYGAVAGHPALGAARYKLAVKNADGRGVYTFCMCPGGTVVAAASEPQGVCVNGMSTSARDGQNANSALLVEVRPDDLDGDDPLEGIKFQRQLESAAYELGCGDEGTPYRAPAQTVGGFMAGQAGRPSATVEPSYPRGVRWAELRECLPGFVADGLAEALPALDGRLHGFANPEAVLTAVEARSSSPVRIVRDGFLQTEFVPGVPSGLYPCGEGGGYAGGIMSSAVDGLRVAEAIVAGLVADGEGAAADAERGDEEG